MFEFERGLLVAMERMGYRLYKVIVKHPWRNWNMDIDGWASGEWSTAEMFVPKDILRVPTRFESLESLVEYLRSVKGRDGECLYPDVTTYYTESVR